MRHISGARYTKQEILLIVVFSATIIVCLGILAYGAVANALAAVPAPAHIITNNVPDGRCHEDDPCWDCSTMGNRICGIQLLPTSPVTLPHTN